MKKYHSGIVIVAFAIAVMNRHNQKQCMFYNYLQLHLRVDLNLYSHIYLFIAFNLL